MKRFTPLLALLLCLSPVCFELGCGLFPKKVEFGQAKVPKYPDKTPAQKETERQVAARLVQKTQETEKAAAAIQAPEAVQKPAQEASELAGGLSLSLGPPERPWQGQSDVLVARLEAQVARQNRALEDLDKKLDKYEGKKIEGTGVVQLPYFVWLGIVAGSIALLIALIHSGISIAALFNPVAAGVKGGMDLAWKGVSQLVKGGGAFLSELEHSSLTTEAKAEVKSLFLTAHKTAQDEDVKKVVSSLPGAAKA